MASLSIGNLVPRQFVEPLKLLGNREWVHIEDGISDPPTSSIKLDPVVLREVSQHTGFLNCLNAAIDHDPSAILTLFAQSKLIANGPKLLKPTSEQCEALEQVDVNVSFAEYEQPFPVFVVELPDAFRRTMSERFGHPCPRFVTTLHDRNKKYIVSICHSAPDQSTTMTVLSPRPQWRHIEDALHFFAETGPDLDQSEALNRIAINFGLMLTRYGVKDCGPVDPTAHAQQQVIAKRKHGRKAELARQQLANTINLIAWSQEVVFCDRPSSSTESIGEGHFKRPHWRRGHFRRQACGTGRLERRLVFVKPCFIHDEVFVGDRADTSYSIRVPQRIVSDIGSST